MSIKKNRHQGSFSLSKKIQEFSKLNIEQIKSLAKIAGIRCEDYREDYLMRRMAYHFNKSRAVSLEEYFHLLSVDSFLKHQLVDYLNVNTSCFFRDSASFDYLRSEVLPEMFTNFPKVNIWSMGCSIGAEIYSVALILSALKKLRRSELIASDIDIDAMNRAKRGEYFQNEIKNIPDEFRGYFNNYEDLKNRTYLSKEIIQEVEFFVYDLNSSSPLNDTLPKKFHLLMCRNVMIYFSPEVKKTLYKKFHDLLEPKGILFIGESEIITNPRHLGFEQINKHFYRKVN
jgi:chemotaxis protein methyltransferase CheR